MSDQYPDFLRSKVRRYWRQAVLNIGKLRDTMRGSEMPLFDAEA